MVIAACFEPLVSLICCLWKREEGEQEDEADERRGDLVNDSPVMIYSYQAENSTTGVLASPTLVRG